MSPGGVVPMQPAPMPAARGALSAGRGALASKPAGMLADGWGNPAQQLKRFGYWNPGGRVAGALSLVPGGVAPQPPGEPSPMAGGMTFEPDFIAQYRNRVAQMAPREEWAMTGAIGAQPFLTNPGVQPAPSRFTPGQPMNLQPGGLGVMPGGVKPMGPQGEWAMGGALGAKPFLTGAQPGTGVQYNPYLGTSINGMPYNPMQGLGGFPMSW
jgi:hypothetical protein